MHEIFYATLCERFVKSPRKTTPPSVALLVETSNGYARGLLRGIRNYVREHVSWSLYLSEQSRGEPAPAWLSRWHGDGIIARIESAQIARDVLSRGVPVVDVSAAREIADMPYVETDDAAIARLALDHLIGRGLRHFGFCGVAGFRWSQLREKHFREQVATTGRTVSVFEAPTRGRRDPSEEDRRALAKWLKSLPKPCGIMAAYDIRGRQVLDVCREQAIRVPDDVAVIGVDNDDLVCDLAFPTLTSVASNSLKTGYEAARLLDKLLRGERFERVDNLIPPIGVVTRGSTEVWAVDDPEVAAAARFIRERALSGIKVADVLEAVPMSRRVLESRFQKLLGRTPHDEITRVQIENVKRLLEETDLPLDAIASRCGYKHVEYMTVAFKREVGVPPSMWRTDR